MVIEDSNKFVQKLRTRFSNLNIVHGNAADLCPLVPQNQKVSAIVSSLPLCSLPAPMTRLILQQWQTLLQHNAVPVQFTYHLRTPQGQTYLTATYTRTKNVWANTTTSHHPTCPLRTPNNTT